MAPVAVVRLGPGVVMAVLEGVVVAEVMLAEVEVMVEGRVGMCLPRIQVWAVEAAFFALFLACSSSLAFFLAFSAFSLSSLSRATRSKSSRARNICSLSLRSCLLTPS